MAKKANKTLEDGRKTKLAAALLLRGDLQKKQAALRARIDANAAVQQGDKPHEDPNKLIAEFNGVTGELAELVYRINLTNLTGKLPDGRTITRALADRDALVQRHAMLTAAANAANKQPDRFGIREIKWVATVSVVGLQKQADDLARTIREANTAIQEANWKLDLASLE